MVARNPRYEREGPQGARERVSPERMTRRVVVVMEGPERLVWKAVGAAQLEGLRVKLDGPPVTIANPRPRGLMDEG